MATVEHVEDAHKQEGENNKNHSWAHYLATPIIGILVYFLVVFFSL